MFETKNLADNTIVWLLLRKNMLVICRVLQLLLFMVLLQDFAISEYVCIASTVNF